MNGNVGATQIIAYVVSGVGFLGAGVIMKQGSNVWGLNTAATLWCSAAVGACAGADLAFEAIALTPCRARWQYSIEVLLVNAINRAPIEESATEAIYEIRVTTKSENLDQVRELLRDQLEAAHYPAKGIDAIEREQGDVELIAGLVGTSADPNELDTVVSRLQARARVTRRRLEFSANNGGEGFGRDVRSGSISLKKSVNNSR